MRRSHLVAAAAAAALFLVLATRRAQAQEWNPPSRQMPDMPDSGELEGGWRGSKGAWLAGTGTGLDQLRASGEGARGGRARLVRFMGGTRPVAVWTDRNGDGKADMIEVYRGGALAFQLIDADYDGTANVLRVYNGGSFVREERL